MSSGFRHPVQAAVECPKPVKSNDPFADFDDLMTEDEKREALHKELDRKLAQHKSRCDIKQNQQDSSSASARSAAQANGQSGSQQQGQAGSSSNASQQNQTSQYSQANQNSQATPDAQPGQYTSPWAQQSAPLAGSGKVMLDPMAQPAEKPASEPQSTATEAAPNDTQQSAAGSSGTGNQSKPQESLFLKTYGGQSALESEKIEDIAGRSAAGGRYGSPGNTGLDRQTPYSPTSVGTPSQTVTISADDAVVTALKKRLKTETDPEKRKEIQAEIDKYEKK